MDNIKFHCPECRQKIGVQASDAGRQMDCPICQSTIVIPARSDLPVQVVVARKSTQAVDPERSAKDFQETIRLTPHSGESKDAAANAELVAAQAELKRLKAELESTTSRLNEVLSERIEHAGRVTEMVEHTSKLEAELKAALEKNEAFETEVARLNELRAKASSFERQNADLRGQLAAQEKQLAAITVVCEEQRAELRNAEAEVQAARADLDAARMQTQSIRRQLKEVGEHFGESERERVELMRQLQESVQHNRLNALTNDLGVAHARLSEQSAKFEALKAERDALLEQIRQREGVVSRATAFEIA